MMKAVNGYLENGRFTPLDVITLPQRVQAVLVYGEDFSTELKPVQTQAQKQRAAFEEFFEGIDAADNEPIDGKDLETLSRVSFRQVADL